MLAAERERLACVRGHRLRARGGAGSLEDKGDVFGGGGWAGGGGQGRAVLGEGEVEAVALQVEAADAGQGGDILRVRGGHHHLHAQLREGEGQLLLAVAGVEGSGGSGGGGGEKGRGHAGAVREDEGDAVAGRDAGPSQLTGKRLDGRAQVGERGIAATGSLDGDCLGGAGGEQLGDRRRRGHASRPPPRGATRCRGRRGGRACTAAPGVPTW